MHASTSFTHDRNPMPGAARRVANAAVTGADLREAADEMTRVLLPHRERDWSVPAGSLSWSCWTTSAHVAHDLLAYAGQVTGRPDDGYLPYDLRVSPDASPTQVLTVVRACSGLLAAAVDAARRTRGPGTSVRAIRPVSPPWAWPRPCCTPTTSPSVSVCRGSRRSG